MARRAGHAREPKNKPIRRGIPMKSRQPYVYTRRLSVAAPLLICLSILAGSAAALAAIVPLG